MPRIKTTNGYIRYTTHPIYPGIKRIDKKLATENLLLLKDILDRNNISYVLIAGTLLGIVRENDFIDHDEDIDIVLPEEYRQQFFDCLHQIIDAGFNIARYDRRGLISIILIFTCLRNFAMISEHVVVGWFRRNLSSRPLN